jgi:hypothetical protein
LGRRESRHIDGFDGCNVNPTHMIQSCKNEEVKIGYGTPSDSECGRERQPTTRETLLTRQEWEEHWWSLLQLLSRVYNIEPVPVRQKECFIFDNPFQDRTLKIKIEKTEILTEGFLVYVGQWLQSQATLWGVSIPTDNTSENLILVYPRGRINAEAEKQTAHFCLEIRPKLHDANVQARRQVELN